MKIKITTLLLNIVLVGSLANTAHASSTSAPHRPQEEARFLLAEKAYREGKFQEYQFLKSKLTQYPLYPYLEYQELQRNIKNASESDIKTFANNYPDCPLTTYLKNQWLITLAKQGRWNEYLNNYEETDSAALRCYYLTALEKTGHTKIALEKTQSIWLTGKSLPDACDAPFRLWLSSSPSKTSYVWQRFYMSFENRNPGLARHLTSYLPKSDQKTAAQWLALYANPQQLLYHAEENKKAYNNKDVVAFGLAQLARHNVNGAAKVWPTYAKLYDFNEQQSQIVISAIAKQYVRHDRKKAPYWLAKINAHFANTDLLEWRVRLALYNEEWNNVLRWINTLPEEEKQDPTWRYWKARALEKTGNPVAAKAIYSGLINTRGFYGFLAAKQLRTPIKIYNQPLQISPQELHAVANKPGVQRAAELYQIKQFQRGNIEWWYAIKNMSEKQQYIAAVLARQWGWYDVSMKTTLKTPHKDDLELRYPTPYTKLIKQYSKRAKLNETMVYGLMRQESLFSATAQSYVGARGLMQLMPITARHVASKHNFKYRNSDQLFEPAMNIAMGTYYLNDLMDLYDRNPVLSATAYNAGPQRVKQWLPKNKILPADIWIENIPFGETRDYVKQVLTNAVIYQYRLGLSPDIGFLIVDVPKA